MQTVLKGKTFIVLASAFEDVGLKALEQPFALTAAYTGMKFKSLLIPNAGVSGQIKGNSKAKDKAFKLGKTVGKH